MSAEAFDEEPDYGVLAEQIAQLEPTQLEQFREATISSRFEVTKIHERHREIIRLLILGKKNKEIALELGVTPVMVSYVRNSRLVQAKIAELHGVRDSQTMKLNERIASLGGVAIDVLEEALEDENTPLRDKINIAQDLLDRAGQKPVARVIADINHSVLTPMEMEEVHRRARSCNLLAIETAIDVESAPTPGTEPAVSELSSVALLPVSSLDGEKNDDN